MYSFTTISNDSQNRTQRRLLFEGFNIHDSANAVSRRHPSTTMITSTPDHKLHEKENEHFEYECYLRDHRFHSMFFFSQ